MTELARLAHGVLFPVLIDLHLSDPILRFLDEGGRALLFGETREEYASGKMSAARVEQESAESWSQTTRAIGERIGPALIALDEDVSAVHRLHRLTPPLPSLAQAQAMTASEFEAAIEVVAAAASRLGVNLLLSPTADVVAGPNPWLAGRTLGDDVATVSRLVASYVRGAQRAGVAAALKHFPGHPTVSGIPAVEEAVVPGSMDSLRPFLAPFEAGIAAGARAVMMGPAVFEAVTPPVASSISPELIALLRQELGFDGLVITNDLDHKATMRERGLDEIVVQALAAGADLLLISPRSVPLIPDLVSAVAAAVENGNLNPERLSDAAGQVARLAKSLCGGN